VLNWRESPWDAAVLGYPTNELLCFAGAADLTEFEEECRARGVGFTSCRLDAGDFDRHQLLRDAGYVQVGTYLDVELPRKKADARVTEAVLPNGMWLRDGWPTWGSWDTDIPIIRDMVRDYEFGPFFDDHRIPREAAHRRMMNRVVALFEEMPVLVCTDGVGVVAWMAVRGGRELVLGGVSRAIRGRVFWAAITRRLFERGADYVWAPISATNLGVMNVYAALGFRFTGCQLQFHRHRR